MDGEIPDFDIVETYYNVDMSLRYQDQVLIFHS
jgi:hypothetical protein